MSEMPDESPVDFDELLDSVDPEFNKSLEDLRRIKSSADVDLEVDDLDVVPEADDEMPNPLAAAPEGSSLVVRLIFRLTNTLAFALFFVRRALESVKFAVQTFKRANRSQKAMAAGLVAIVGFGVYVLMANLRGTWVPLLNAPVVGRLEPFAEHVEEFEPGEDLVSLALAFPPENHEFLFKPFKVNMRSTAENPHPMGAFEFVVSLDTKDTATEARDREVEFVDLVQRIFEEQTFRELETELGKGRLKARILTELNEKLSAGRVTTVNFKTFILKP